RFSRDRLPHHPLQRDALRAVQILPGGRGMSTLSAIGSVTIAVLAGAIRGGTPFLFVSTGECLTEKSGKINLGLEGVLLMGAMSAYAVSYKAQSAFAGLLAAMLVGMALGLIHAWLTQLPKVNDIAVGIAMI